MADRLTMRAVTGLALALGLAACGAGADGNTAAASSETATGNMGGVVREQVSPPTQAPVQAMEQTAPIQSQPGPGGSQVDLMKLAVTGDILTATFRCSSSEKFNYESFQVPKFSLIDDATSQRIAVLKDNAGNWLASEPGGGISAACGPQPGIFWVKFPAPPVTSATVSVNLPETAPFDGVPVTR